jgi:hypothetical protein
VPSATKFTMSKAPSRIQPLPEKFIVIEPQGRAGSCADSAYPECSINMRKIRRSLCKNLTERRIAFPLLAHTMHARAITPDPAKKLSSLAREHQFPKWHLYRWHALVPRCAPHHIAKALPACGSHSAAGTNP